MTSSTRSVPNNPVPSRPLTVLGSINLDLIATAERLPTAGETIGGGALSRQAGGKGANQAAAAARLDGSARMIGAVGDDDAGREMLEALTAAGVDVSDVAHRGTPTGTALIVVDAAGENQIVVCPGANAEVSLEGVEFAEDETLLCQLEVGLDVVVEAARRHPGFFALNAAPAQSLPAELVERCDLVIVNETEYELIPELANARMVAVTYGKDGSALLRDGKEVARAAGLRANVVNTIGAGDAFCAAFVLGLRRGLSDEQALAAANAVGADAVGQHSSQPQLGRLESYVGAASA
ncbi:ribokinase [Arthrobacter sp. SW1]|uniref:PfkB family carbohydrate kinase n=1 Tax=Arthrobacter sp. SW1 TaxID=1920889 RepID=UPI000877C5E2|nr:PfkB family carbohydrate kinase [Arthrobacter sp. SW1]OFI38750.1 ribokinase [Arthrobacter sp. SW1]